MKNILVPVDFSSSCKYASKLAIKIAKKTNAKISLIHLIELPKGIVDMGSRSKFSIPESMLYLKKVKEKLLHFIDTNFSKNTNVDYFIKLNTPYKGILKHAEKMDTDLIIMGYRGHSEFEEIVIGSNTEKVVRSSKRPVIVVKKDFENFKFKNIVLASNFKEENKETFLKFVDFANIFNSKIHLLKVNTPSNFNKTTDSKNIIKKFISNFNFLKYEIKIYNDISVEKGILNFSNEINADLICLSTHGRSGLAHLFNGSIVRKLTKNALKPMLTVKI